MPFQREIITYSSGAQRVGLPIKTETSPGWDLISGIEISTKSFSNAARRSGLICTRKIRVITLYCHRKMGALGRYSFLVSPFLARLIRLVMLVPASFSVANTATRTKASRVTSSIAVPRRPDWDPPKPPIGVLM